MTTNGKTKILDIKLDVTDALSFNEPASIAATVHLPDPANLRKDGPIVCFGKPGGGYGRKYYTLDLPGPTGGAQSQWHADRGWIFVAIDHLGVGDSSIHDIALVNFSNVALASQSAEAQILHKLREGSLSSGFPPILDPVTIGIGQSMGGCLTVVQQGQYHCYDGIGVLGFSAVHTYTPVKPGDDPIYAPWWPRDRPGGEPLRHAPLPSAPKDKHRIGKENKFGSQMSWVFHYDDIDPAIIEKDVARLNRPATSVDEQAVIDCPPWGSLTFPLLVAQLSVTPGVIAAEAAAVMSPVLVAIGERDVVPDPKGEARAYQSATSIDLFICPRMGHMHNFAGTREIFWRRIELFAEFAREIKLRGIN